MIRFLLSLWSPSLSTIFFARCVMVQKRNMMVAPEETAESELIAYGTFSIPTNAENKRAISMNKGAPGG